MCVYLLLQLRLGGWGQARIFLTDQNQTPVESVQLFYVYIQYVIYLIDFYGIYIMYVLRIRKNRAMLVRTQNSMTYEIGVSLDKVILSRPFFPAELEESVQIGVLIPEICVISKMSTYPVDNLWIVYQNST